MMYVSPLVASLEISAARPVSAVPSIIAFADCELCVWSRVLRREGRTVSLEPKVFMLLEYLVAHRHRVVSQDELRRALWSGVNVSNCALTRLVKELRRALGDSGEKQRVIRAAFKFGYQFVAPVGGGECVESAPEQRFGT
jgi:DNA-binding winged helix-turn-helix (wHTH) protein